MVENPARGTIFNLTEQFNRRSYVLNKFSLLVWDFRILYNGTQSYYTFKRHCKIDIILQKLPSACYTIELDNRSVAIVENCEIRRTRNLNVTVIENPSDPNSNATIYLVPNINMKRFMFRIFAIDQTKKRLVAQINAMSPGSSKLPSPDANTFTVDITEEANDDETELALILCVMIDEMRGYVIIYDGEKEDLYNND